jgi:hypothetical protein
MVNYEEQKSIADHEATWQNQLTVVTNSVTAANTARANATTTMGNNYNSLPSKLASIEASKQANAALLLVLPRLVDFAMPPQGLLCGSVPHSLP